MTQNPDGSFHFSIEDIWRLRRTCRLMEMPALELGWEEPYSEPTINVAAYNKKRKEEK